MSRKRAGLVAIFAAPMALAVLSLIGLVGALLADGAWDGIGAGLLATSAAAVVWSRLRRPGERRRGEGGLAAPAGD
jgi:hypothetical protein